MSVLYLAFWLLTVGPFFMFCPGRCLIVLFNGPCLALRSQADLVSSVCMWHFPHIWAMRHIFLTKSISKGISAFSHAQNIFVLFFVSQRIIWDTIEQDSYQRNSWHHIIEAAHDKSYNETRATSEDSDQPAHTRSLIRVFADRMRLLHPPAYSRRDKQERLLYLVDV